MNLNNKKIEIAERFVKILKPAIVNSWNVFGYSTRGKLLSIYHNLVAGEYGNVSSPDEIIDESGEFDCVIRPGRTFELEIFAADSKTGKSVFFKWLAPD